MRRKIVKEILRRRLARLASACLVVDVVPCSAAKRVSDDELEDVEGDVGDDAEGPDGGAPTPTDPLHPAELPVGVHRDARGHQLRRQECRQQQEPRPLHERPAPRPRHEDERLADYAHLQVQRRHQLLLVLLDRPHPKRLLQQEFNANEIMDVVRLSHRRRRRRRWRTVKKSVSCAR